MNSNPKRTGSDENYCPSNQSTSSREDLAWDNYSPPLSTFADECAGGRGKYMESSSSSQFASISDATSSSWLDRSMSSWSEVQSIRSKTSRSRCTLNSNAHNRNRAGLDDTYESEEMKSFDSRSQLRHDQHGNNAPETETGRNTRAASIDYRHKCTHYWDSIQDTRSDTSLTESVTNESFLSSTSLLSIQNKAEPCRDSRRSILRSVQSFQSPVNSEDDVSAPEPSTSIDTGRQTRDSTERKGIDHEGKDNSAQEKPKSNPANVFAHKLSEGDDDSNSDYLSLSSGLDIAPAKREVDFATKSEIGRVNPNEKQKEAVFKKKKKQRVSDKKVSSKDYDQCSTDQIENCVGNKDTRIRIIKQEPRSTQKHQIVGSVNNQSGHQSVRRPVCEQHGHQNYVKTEPKNHQKPFLTGNSAVIIKETAKTTSNSSKRCHGDFSMNCNSSTGSEFNEDPYQDASCTCFNKVQIQGAEESDLSSEYYEAKTDSDAEEDDGTQQIDQYVCVLEKRNTSNRESCDGNGIRRQANKCRAVRGSDRKQEWFANELPINYECIDTVVPLIEHFDKAVPVLRTLTAESDLISHATHCKLTIFQPPLSCELILNPEEDDKNASLLIAIPSVEESKLEPISEPNLECPPQGERKPSRVTAQIVPATTSSTSPSLAIPALHQKIIGARRTITETTTIASTEPEINRQPLCVRNVAAYMTSTGPNASWEICDSNECESIDPAGEKKERSNSLMFERASHPFETMTTVLHCATPRGESPRMDNLRTWTKEIPSIFTVRSTASNVLPEKLHSAIVSYHSVFIHLTTPDSIKSTRPFNCPGMRQPQKTRFVSSPADAQSPSWPSEVGENRRAESLSNKIELNPSASDIDGQMRSHDAGESRTKSLRGDRKTMPCTIQNADTELRYLSELLAIAVKGPEAKPKNTDSSHQQHKTTGRFSDPGITTHDKQRVGGAVNDGSSNGNHIPVQKSHCTSVTQVMSRPARSTTGSRAVGFASMSEKRLPDQQGKWQRSVSTRTIQNPASECSMQSGSTTEADSDTTTSSHSISPTSTWMDRCDVAKPKSEHPQRRRLDFSGAEEGGGDDKENRHEGTTYRRARIDSITAIYSRIPSKASTRPTACSDQPLETEDTSAGRDRTRTRLRGLDMDPEAEAVARKRPRHDSREHCRTTDSRDKGISSTAGGTPRGRNRNDEDLCEDSKQQTSKEDTFGRRQKEPRRFQVRTYDNPPPSNCLYKH